MLFYDSVGPNPRVVRVFAAERGVALPKTTIDLRGGENRQPGYMAKNPAGQLPCLELDNGEVIAEITNDTHYANPNLASTKYVNPAILNDPAMYPTPDVMKRTYMANEASVEFERVRTRVWTRIKTNH